MVIHDAQQHMGMLFLQANDISDGTEVVSKVKTTSRLDTREDCIIVPRWRLEREAPSDSFRNAHES